MGWSRLIDTPLGLKARSRYMEESYRRYHTWAHVLRLYHHAEFTLRLPYDLDLDAAILAHDVIYDAAGRNEGRSADWLASADPDCSPASVSMIHHTETHAPREDDNRIILLDLMDLADPAHQMRNLFLIMEESCLMRSIHPKAHFQGAVQFLDGLVGRLSLEAIGRTPPGDRDHFIRIRAGVEAVLAASKMNLGPGAANGL
jgi:hypothetical protein